MKTTIFILGLILILGMLGLFVTALIRGSQELPPPPPPKVDDPAEYNETLLAQWDNWNGAFGCTPQCAARLIEHPTIMCRHHADRPAVIRSDMKYPECRACHVEDPYV